MLTLTYACHVAHLDTISGIGVLVMPRPADDMDDLHASAWNAVTRELLSKGWELDEDEDGDPWLVGGVTVDGREVLSLHERGTMPDPDRYLETWTQLAELAGIV